MKRSIQITLIVFCFSAILALGQGPGIMKKDLSQAEKDRIIKKLTENETKFREALTNYVFNRNATIQTVGLGGNITGTYRR
jgi:hypothetical protein